jgi:hypothetical protein
MNMIFALSLLVIVIYLFLLLILGIYFVARSQIKYFHEGVKITIVKRFVELAFFTDVKGKVSHKKLILCSLLIAILMLSIRFMEIW